MRINHTIFLLCAIFLTACSNTDGGNDTSTAAQPITLETPAASFQNNTPKEISELISSGKEVLILDVRSEREYKEPNTNPQSPNGYYIKDALHLHIDQLPARLSEIEEYKNKDIVVYCSHASRSARASKLLVENGFQKVHNMVGGLSTWLYADAEAIPNKANLLMKREKK